jgi:CHAT domain-containing protein
VNASALVYSVSDTSVTALYVDGAQRKQHRAGETRDLLPRIDELRGELRKTRVVARGRVPLLQEFTESWGRALLPEEVLATKPDVLVVIPHAALHDMPLHLVAADSGPPLGAQVGVAYASSISLLARCAARNPARENDAPPRSLLGGGTDVASGESSAFREIAERLAGLFEEAVIFGDTWPFSRNSVKAAFRRDPQPDVLCVVAHGFIDPDNHRLSGLLVDRDEMGVGRRAIPLYGSYFDFRDLPLRDVPAAHATARAAEVLTTAELEIDGALSTHLVALLGCSAGWARLLQGDEPASLAQAFLHIGAPSVIAPMWDSDVRATRDWVERFFAAWVQDREPKAVAARRALAELHELGYGPERTGALTLRGDWL